MPPKKKKDSKTSKTTKKKNPKTEIAILQAALKVFGTLGYEETTISKIARAANLSEATIYEYFTSKEGVLFSLPDYYTAKEIKKMRDIEHYLHGAKAKMRALIQAYLEFYENNSLYSSVALLSLKGNRNFIKSKGYIAVREATHIVIEIFEEGIKEGVFRDDLDKYIVRNLVIGTIEHLAIQWVLLNRPKRITDYIEVIYDMVIRAIEKRAEKPSITLKVEGLNLETK